MIFLSTPPLFYLGGFIFVVIFAKSSTSNIFCQDVFYWSYFFLF